MSSDIPSKEYLENQTYQINQLLSIMTQRYDNMENCLYYVTNNLAGSNHPAVQSALRSIDETRHIMGELQEGQIMQFRGASQELLDLL